MKLLGIDYGTKRVGIALSDDGGNLAFPNKVLVNDKNLIDEIKTIIENNLVEIIVMGESQDFQMKDNPVMGKIKKFADQISKVTGLGVEFQPEFMTSSQISGETYASTRKEKSRKENKKDEMLDAKAAAIILQSYIDYKK